MKITLLTSSNCIPCKVIKKDFKNMKIDYVELAASEYPSYYVDATPYIIIEKDNEIVKSEHVKNIPEMIQYIMSL